MLLQLTVASKARRTGSTARTYRLRSTTGGTLTPTRPRRPSGALAYCTVLSLSRWCAAALVILNCFYLPFRLLSLPLFPVQCLFGTFFAAFARHRRSFSNTWTRIAIETIEQANK